MGIVKINLSNSYEKPVIINKYNGISIIVLIDTGSHIPK